MSTREAADILGVHPQTIRRWAQIGHIRVVRLPSGQIRVPLDEIERLTTPAA